MLREGVKCKKKNIKKVGGPSIPQIGNIHGGLKLQITQKSIYRAKKLTPAVILHRLESNRVNNLTDILSINLVIDLFKTSI